MVPWEVASPFSPFPSSFMFSEPFCQLQSVRHLSIPVAVEFKPRMNCPRKFGLPLPPSASLHPVGQASKLNAMTAPGGTEYETSSFHLEEESWSPTATERFEYAAYAAPKAVTTSANQNQRSIPSFIFLTDACMI